MGGFGSGFQGAAKGTTAETDRLRLQDWGNRVPGLALSYRLTRGGCLELGKVRIVTGHDSLTLTFTPPDRGAPWQQTLQIARAPCTLGGSRPFFRLPSMLATLRNAVQGPLWLCLPQLQRAELPEHAGNTGGSGCTSGRQDQGTAGLAAGYRVRAWPQAEGHALADLLSPGGRA